MPQVDLCLGTQLPREIIHKGPISFLLPYDVALRYGCNEEMTHDRGIALTFYHLYPRLAIDEIDEFHHSLVGSRMYDHAKGPRK